MELSTERALLTLLTEEDFPAVLDLFHEPETFNFIQHLQNKSDEQYVSILNKRLDQIQEGTGFHWVARTLDSRELIGVLNLSIVPTSDKTQLGFQLSKRYWNQGFGLELARAVRDTAVLSLGHTVIYGIVDRNNVASKKILKKLNFQPSIESFLIEKDIEIHQYNPSKNNLPSITKSSKRQITK
jgi:RimJ/RimL family protein N-acetyltransferase